MRKVTVRKALLFLFILLFVALFVAGVSAMPAREAEGLEYSQSEFAITSYQSLEALLAYKNQSFSGKTIRLYRDFDLGLLSSSVITFTSFAGTFDGNGHVLYGCKGNLFEEITATGRVCNISFVDSVVTTKAALTTINRGTVENVYFHGSHLSSAVCGVIKENRGTATNVRSYLEVSTSASNAYLLMEGNYGTFTDCFYVGSVYSTSTAEPYTVTVTEEEYSI